MSFTVTDNIDWNSMEAALEPDPDDMFEYGEIIVRNMCDRILQQMTAKGEPLDENTDSWKAQKLREGKPAWTLQYTGGLREPSRYLIIQDGDEVFHIELEAAYRDIHLDLIEISDNTGKNYKDWFGWNTQDQNEIVQLASERLEQRLDQWLLQR